MKKTKRFLLVTAALTTAASATTACGKSPATPDQPEQKDAEVLPLPANPKGSFYDAGVVEPTPPPPPPPPPPTTDGGGPIKPHPLPANPKGSFYDGGPKVPPPPRK